MHFVINVKRFYSFQDKQDGEDDKKIDLDVGDKLSENLADFAGVDNITNESDRNFGHLVQLEDHHNDAKKASENLNKLEEDHGDAAKRIL